MAQLFSLIIGYFIGAIVQTSYWYGRRQNVDIRNYGSGNAGTTNAMRTLGRKAGIITAIGDVAKVFLSALISWLIFRGTGMPATLIFLYSGLGTVVGHNFPFFMKFKGGKGVATTAGVIISLLFQPNALWVMTLIGFITFFGVLIITRYASVASLVLVTEFLIEFIIWSGSGNTALRGGQIAQGICLVIIITALCYLRHLGNIERLLDGNERKFGSNSNSHSSSNNHGRAEGRIKRSSDEEKYYSYDEDDAQEEPYTSSAHEDYDDEDVYAEDTDLSAATDEEIADGAYEDFAAEPEPEEDISPVREVASEELEAAKEEAPKRKFIWDEEKQCYVRYKESDR